MPTQIVASAPPLRCRRATAPANLDRLALMPAPSFQSSFSCMPSDRSRARRRSRSLPASGACRAPSSRRGSRSHRVSTAAGRARPLTALVLLELRDDRVRHFPAGVSPRSSSSSMAKAVAASTRGCAATLRPARLRPARRPSGLRRAAAASPYSSSVPKTEGPHGSLRVRRPGWASSRRKTAQRERLRTRFADGAKSEYYLPGETASSVGGSGEAA